MPRRPGSSRGLVVPLALLLLLGFPRAQSAHEIPPRVTVLAFVKPEGRLLRVLVRVPLEAVRDVELPLRGQTYLDVERASPMLRDAAATWIAEYLTLYENDAELTGRAIAGARISLPTDRSFETYQKASSHFRDPILAGVTDLPWQQAMLDVSLEYPIASERSRFAIRPALAHLGVRTSTALRFITPGGTERAFRYDGDPGVVRLDPRWHQAALHFVRLGIAHILGGVDHLLFVLCLVIPFRRLRPLVGVVTAFTVAHSVTLAASVLGLAPDALWFPPLIELLVALSILWMALENIAGPRLQQRWMLAFGFGLVHGFAFSFALRESMQFAGSHLAASLAAFNVGVEAGQLLALAAAIPILNLLFKRVVAERMGTIILSALVAHTAWHWMLDRGSLLRAYHVALPALDVGFLVSAMRAAMAVIVVLLAMWGMSVVGGRIWRRIALALLVLVPAAAAAQADTTRTTHAGVYSAAQAERGKMQYAVSCRSCHTAASHTGVTFAKWWKDRTLADLFGFMSTQMPKNDPGSLEPGQYADVVAYLLEMNAMPAGRADLLPDSSVLAQIRIVLPAPVVKPARKRATKSPTRRKNP